MSTALVAGGAGVAPFLSWLRQLDGELAEPIDFFYSSDGEAPFAEEIGRIAERHPSLRAHVIDSSIEGRLAAQRVLAAIEDDRHDLFVFLCGPKGMLSGLQHELVRAEMPARHIHRERLDWR